MRKKRVVGNWKMNLVANEVNTLVDRVIALSKEINADELVFIPPYVYLENVSQRVNEYSNIHVGVQDCSANQKGAYTGEISADMVDSLGGKYVLVGHSERRKYHNEGSQLLTEKVARSLENNLTPIFCCGETLEIRENGTYADFVVNQIHEGLLHLDKNQIQRCVIAYEPVWAIGTGRTASAAQAQEIHLVIRTALKEKYGQIADDISILYGGSCKPSNAKEIFSQADVDGGLIGGASLKAEDFIAIAKSF